MNGENEKTIQDFDENSTMILRMLPGFLWSFYKALVDEGFTADQALELTKTQLLGYGHD